MSIKRKSSQYSRKILILTKGTRCANCEIDAKDNIVFHHVVPIAVGGRDVFTNIIPLCVSCHNLIHHENDSYYSHSELVKLGIQKARMNNKQIGRKRTKYDDLDEKTIAYCKRINNKEINISAAARELNITRPSVYKYLALYNEYNNNNNGGTKS